VNASGGTGPADTHLPEARVLARILLLQSALQAAVEETQLAATVARGLQGIDGVREVVVCAEGRVLASTLPEDGAPAQCRRLPLGVPWSYRCPGDCANLRDGTWTVLPLATGRRGYGSLMIQFDAEELRETYHPFLANTANLVALQMETARQARQLSLANQKLAAAVERSTRELEIERARLGLALAGLSFGVWDFDCATGSLSFNERWAQRFGWPPEGPRSHLEAYRERIHPGDAALVEAAVRAHWDGETPHFEAEHRLRDADGEYIWLLMHGRVVERDARGSPARLCGTQFDVTERRRGELERIRLSTAIEQAAESIVITDREGTIQYVNPAFTRVTGYSREEALGQNPRILKSGKHDAAFYQQMWSTILGGETWSGRLVNQRRDGTFFDEDCTISPVFGDSGAIEHFVAVKRDVSIELKLEEQLRQAQKIESVGRLAAGVAHDFNNMLTPIMGYAGLLKLVLPSGAQAHNYVLEIEKAAERSRELVQQLLAFSRKQLLQLKPMDMCDVVRGVGRLLRRTLRENIELRLVLAPEACQVLAGVGQIEQILMNLAVNAQDAMPGGGPLTIEVTRVVLDELFCSIHHGVQPGQYCLLVVSDTGSGMDEETRQRLFEPFFSTKGELGTGLGLAIVQGIVEQHGGSIWVYSEKGRGTTFKIYIPAVTTGPAAAGPALDARPVSGASATILLVEDNEMVRNLAEAILSTHGYLVLTAGSGLEALSVLDRRDGAVDLLITDLVMPGMDGRDLREQALLRRPDLKVLLMSGYTDALLSSRGTLDASAPFLPKPFTAEEFLAQVRGLLRQA
jgi:PAS domain S-box-containing protein